MVENSSSSATMTRRMTKSHPPLSTSDPNRHHHCQEVVNMSLSTDPASPIRDDDLGGDNDDDIHEKPSTSVPLSFDDDEIEFIDYVDESQLEHVMKLVIQDLSEPYSIFTYRYFLHRFPELCILAVPRNSREPIGCVVGKIDQEEIMTSAAGGGAGSPPTNNSGGDEDVHGNGHTSHSNTNQNNETMAKVPTGYIGMLAVQSKYRRKGIGKALVRQVLQRMKDMGCTSVTLETEVKNGTAQRLYQDCFGFVREELLVRYYLNWGDAYRLRLWF